MQYEKVTEHPASPKKLLETLTDPAYLDAQWKHYNSIECNIEEVSRTDVSLVQKIHSKDKSKHSNQIEEATEVREWDLVSLSCKWSRTPPANTPPGMVKITGTFRISGAAETSKLIAEGDIDIKVPIIGKKIAGKIVDKIVNDGGKFEKFLNDYLKSAG